MEKTDNKLFYDFGAFRLDVKNRLLLGRGDVPLPLTLKEFEVLLFLVENAGEVVEKNTLLDAVWRDVFIEEGTLTRNISRLRKKLEAETNESGAEKIIETLPKRGYRFLPQVTRSNGSALVIEETTTMRVRVEETLEIAECGVRSAELPEVSDQRLNLIDRRKIPPSALRTPHLLWLAFALAAIAVAVYQIYFRAETKPSVVVRVAPFSGVLGRENYPAFSPDGKQIAFAWNGGDADNLDIYVRLLSAGEPIRLTDTEFTEQHPTFSPDGSHVAFVRSLKTGGEVILVPALGGAERRVAKLFSGFASVSFSPDGQSIALIDTADSTTDKNYAVHLINLQTGERRRLNQPGEYAGETTPRFSPDGKSLAFVRVFHDRAQDLFVAPVSGGEPRQITSDRKTIHSLAWSADGAEIFFVSFRGKNQTNVWRVAVGSSRVDLQACKLEYSIVSPK